MRSASLPPVLAAFALVAAIPALAACAGAAHAPARDFTPPPPFNLAHLDYLGEDAIVGGDTLRFIHIYADAPDFRFVGDADEGIACVDDAARAAVLYLRHFELTGDAGSRDKAIRLLRFVRRLQAESGLFHNFVWDRSLRINTEHVNSLATEVSWWTARAVWALGEGARVLRSAAPEEAAAAESSARRVEPHLDRLLTAYPTVADEGGRPFPQWLVSRTAADATSELLLGLIALQQAAPAPDGLPRIRRFAEGLARLKFGSLTEFPFGGHASWEGGWHAWGNSQTMGLASASRLGFTDSAALESAESEANTLFAHLLVEGWLHEMTYSTGAGRAFEQIAYDIRPAAVGLVRLFEATGDERYATMAGLAAAWFTGANPAGAIMADPANGRGYDGILDSTRVNGNSGAESTIEAQLTLLEIGRHPEAYRWLYARPAPPRTVIVDGRTVRARAFQVDRVVPEYAVVVLDAPANESRVLVGAEALRFVSTHFR